jgi:hypothetical protein
MDRSIQPVTEVFSAFEVAGNEVGLRINKHKSRKKITGEDY